MDNAYSPSGTHSLEQRLRHLEEQARFTLDVLEMASTLGDFQTSINKLHEPTALLEETIHRIGELIHFSASAFYLVDENSSDFALSFCVPPAFRSQLDTEVQLLIDNGVFALAVRENRPITVYSRDNQYRLVLHVLATTSRTRGMFVGVMSKGERNLSGILMSLLSIVLKHCANAIESFELYRLFRLGDREQRGFVDSLPVAVLETNAEGVLTYANNDARGMMPLTVGKHLVECIAQKHRDAFQSVIRACVDSTSVNSCVVSVISPAGHEEPVTLRAAGVRTSDSLVHVRCVFVPLDT